MANPLIGSDSSPLWQKEPSTTGEGEKTKKKDVARSMPGPKAEMHRVAAGKVQDKEQGLPNIPQPTSDAGASNPVGGSHNVKKGGPKIASSATRRIYAWDLIDRKTVIEDDEITIEISEKNTEIAEISKEMKKIQEDQSRRIKERQDIKSEIIALENKIIQIQKKHNPNSPDALLKSRYDRFKSMLAEWKKQF